MLTMSQYGRKHGLSRQRIHQLILQGRIKGARKTKVLGGPKLGLWIIPESARIKPLTTVK